MSVREYRFPLTMPSSLKERISSYKEAEGVSTLAEATRIILTKYLNLYDREVSENARQ